MKRKIASIAVVLILVVGVAWTNPKPLMTNISIGRTDFERTV